MSWTTDRVEYLRKRWIEGADASTIAMELGNVTRNAVLGKIHRLGIKRESKDPLHVYPRRPLNVNDRKENETVAAFTKRAAVHQAKLDLLNAKSLEDVRRLMGDWIDKGYIDFSEK